MKYDNQLRYALRIVDEYDGSIPLAIWLKEFYRNHKQMGGSDRKTVSAMVYSYFRLGHNHYDSPEQRMLAAIGVSPELAHVNDYFTTQKTADETGSMVDIEKIFPWPDELSSGIDIHAFNRSFLVQPDVFLRIRPGHQHTVKEKLGKAEIPFSTWGDDCISVRSTTKLGDVLILNKEAVVQDKSSQRTGELFDLVRHEPASDALTVWDCCAGSGGKSLLAFDKLDDISLTVSDIRQSIIQNLKNRFHEAGLEKYRAFIADLSKDAVSRPDKYDLIIADVPCTGSGTWSRTPEQLFFSTLNKADYYSSLQKSIGANVISSMKPRSYLLYITCSVFRKENEEVTEFLESRGLQIIKQQVYAGYHEKADTLFAALLTNRSV